MGTFRARKYVHSIFIAFLRSQKQVDIVVLD